MHTYNKNLLLSIYPRNLDSSSIHCRPSYPTLRTMPSSSGSMSRFSTDGPKTPGSWRNPSSRSNSTSPPPQCNISKPCLTLDNGACLGNLVHLPLYNTNLSIKCSLCERLLEPTGYNHPCIIVGLEAVEGNEIIAHVSICSSTTETPFPVCYSDEEENTNPDGKTIFLERDACMKKQTHAQVNHIYPFRLEQLTPYDERNPWSHRLSKHGYGNLLDALKGASAFHELKWQPWIYTREHKSGKRDPLDFRNLLETKKTTNKTTSAWHPKPKDLEANIISLEATTIKSLTRSPLLCGSAESWKPSTDTQAITPVYKYFGSYKRKLRRAEVN